MDYSRGLEREGSLLKLDPLSGMSIDSRKRKLFNFFEILVKIGLGGVLFFIPISNALISIFTGLAVLGFIGKKIVEPDFRWLKTKQNIFLALFLFFIGLSLINSGQYFEKSLVALFLKWGKYILLSLIAQDSIKGRKDLLALTGAFLFSATLAALSGITQLAWGIEFLRGRNIIDLGNGIKAVTSSFNYYNGFAAYLIIPFALCVALLEKPGAFRKIPNYFILVLGVILAFCIFHTYSRGGWVGVLVSLLAMLAISRSRNVLLVLIFISAIVLLTPGFRERFLMIFQFGGDADRFRYWQAAGTMFRDNPFLGKGVGTFMVHFQEYLPNVYISYAHNCFLQILAESGIFSLIAFLGFVGLALYKAIKKFFAERDALLLGGVCGLAGFLTHSFFEVNLYSLALATLFWLWIGIVEALGSDRSI